MTMHNAFSVVEDNGGGLTLFIFKSHLIAAGTVICAYSGYEHTPGQLSQDITKILTGEIAPFDWDKVEADQYLYNVIQADPMNYKTVAEGYQGGWHLIPENMGVAAQLEFASTFERIARKRIWTEPELSPYADLIFSDWPNWDEHMRWIAYAPVPDIVTWAKNIYILSDDNQA